MGNKIVIWFRAVFLDYPYWRIHYKDGKKSYLLYYAEAKSVAETFNGKVKIDYTVNQQQNEQNQ